ncbi:MAG: hypothetical protein LRY71_05670 [Bacillaceae bacterium]|nr:hypothetical protein [Bacillaceae bacterium]
MRDLLDIILGNSFLMVVIIGAIFKFLKAKGEAEETQKKASEKAQPNQKKKDEVDWKQIFGLEEVFEEQKVPEKPKTKKESSPKLTNQYIEKYDEVKRQNRGTKKKENDQSPIYKDDITKAKNELDIDFSKITKHDAMKGVIWAEVLGKPRAKNRHRSYVSQQKG